MLEALNELNQFIASNTKEKVDSYSQEYKNSKWYKEPTLNDVFGDTIAVDIAAFRSALERGDDVYAYVKEFEKAATQYGASWFDEDLDCERTGYEWETTVYATLRNIAAKKEGIGLISWKEFYEGYGTC